MRSTIAGVLVALFALPIAAQLPVAGEHIEVTLVEVPVNVVNREGQPIRNLTADNFELLDNGQSRKITHFDVMDLGASVRKQLVGLPAAAASRNFLILFDVDSSAPGTLMRARDAARSFVNSAATEGDRIGVGTLSARSGFRLITSFTTDRKLVADAITTLGSPKFFHPVDPLLLSAIEMHADADMAEAGRGQFSETLAEELRLQARNLDRASNDVQREFIRRTLDRYSELASLLDRVPGRKQVIVLSEGFDAKMIHGRETLASNQARDEIQMVERGESWKVDTDNRYGDARTADELQGMIEVCRRSDVVLNAIDIRGLRTAGADARDLPAGSNESLFLLTHDTGGMVMKNANSLQDDFQRLLRAQELVYVLGFQVPNGAAGKFHSLKIKLINVPGGRAFHRAGYSESSKADAPIERTLTAASIIVNQIPQSDLGVRTLVTPFPQRDGRAQVPVIVEIDGRSILRTAKASQIQSELFIYAFDDGNVIRDFIHQPIALDLGKLRDRLQQRGIRVYETLMLPPGHYSIRTLVRAGAQSLYGYSGANVEVPAFGQPAVFGGSAIDGQPGEWVPVKPPDRQGVPRDYPFLIGGTMVVPSAAPVLRPGVPAQLGLYVGNVAADGMNVAAAVQGKDTPVKVAARSVAPDGTAKLLLDFVPPPLPPGDYILTLRVPDAALARNSAEVPFAVR